MSTAPSSPARLRNDDFPRLFVVSDRTSIIAQRRHVWFARWDLALVVLAAAAGVFGGLESSSSARSAYIASAALLAGAIAIELIAERQKPENDWYDGRAVAESVKTTTWRYMMRAEPYDGSDEASDASFITVLQQTAAARPELPAEHEDDSNDAWAITPTMRRVRSLPLVERRACYLRERARNQQQWYATKSDANSKQGKLWFWLGVAARVLALVTAGFYIVHPTASGIVEFFATVGAAATAWNQLRRHTELSRSYGLAAQELESLGNEVEMAADEETFGEKVIDTESAISREHTMWMAKRLEEPPARVMATVRPK